MIRYRSGLVVALILLLSNAQADVDCEQLYESHLASDMELSYEAFDQTMDSGFRVLSGQGCEKEAADLIQVYIEHNAAEERSLRWHVAQLRAMHGATEEAVEYARTVLLENEDFSERALRWNDYVLATIAFLEKDMDRLRLHRDKVEEGVGEHPGNEMNLRLLDALIDNFNTDYATALKNL